MRTLFYPGSFDPPTLGHMDILAKALRLADRVVIGIGVNPGKTPLFTAQERQDMLLALASPQAEVAGGVLEVVIYEGLTIEAARQMGASGLVRGLRNARDYDEEMQLAGMNAQLAPDLPTLFLPAMPHLQPISASLVRQVVLMGGDVTPFVPSLVAQRLREKLA